MLITCNISPKNPFFFICSQVASAFDVFSEKIQVQIPPGHTFLFKFLKNQPITDSFPASGLR